MRSFSGGGSRGGGGRGGRGPPGRGGPGGRGGSFREEGPPDEIVGTYDVVLVPLSTRRLFQLVLICCCCWFLHGTYVHVYL